MAETAHIVLRKTARLVRRGETKKAERRLGKAIDAGLFDIRLYVRRAIAGGDYKSLKEHLDKGNKKSGAGWFFLALDALRRDDIGQTKLFCRNALSMAPRNLSVSALLAIADFIDGDREPLFSISLNLPHTSIHVQALALSAIEKAIISQRLSDTGVTPEDDRLGGPPGWIMDRLDDFAVLVYWLIWKVMNTILNIANSKKRAVYSLVLDGDLFEEGFRQKKRAAQYYLRALELDSDNQEALESMLVKSIENKEYDDAMTFLSRLAQSASQKLARNPHLAKWKADIFFLMKKFPEAEPLYEKVSDHFKLDYMLFYRLGLCRLRRGDDTGAHGYFEKSLGLIHHGLIAKRLEFLSGIH